MIQAAGVVLIRSADEPQVLIIHRAHRDDWSLPKGKLEPGELAAVAAVRETLEETGYLVQLQAALTPVSYKLNGVLKTVNNWSATQLAHDAAAVPNSEVDKIRWVTLSEAKLLLSYEHDLLTVAEAIAVTQAGTTTAVIVRLAISTDRAEFSGEDLNRPLAAAGFSQVPEISAVLAAYGVTALISSPAIRCQQTFQHYADQDQILLELNPLLLEDNSDFTEIEWRALLNPAQPIAICTHLPVIDELAEYEPAAAAFLLDLPPAAVVVLCWDREGELLTAERHEI